MIVSTHQYGGDLRSSAKHPRLARPPHTRPRTEGRFHSLRPPFLILSMRSRCSDFHVLAALERSMFFFFSFWVPVFILVLYHQSQRALREGEGYTTLRDRIDGM
jgi:hypothetical protein